MNWSDTVLFVGLQVLGHASIYYALLALLYAREWIEAPLPSEVDAALPALTLLRPLKSGVPALREKLAALVRAMQPGDQLVLGVDEDSDEAGVSADLRAAFPAEEILVVACRAGAALNPKISKLVQMTPHARHDHWILSDSETLIDAAWLDAFRREWLANQADVLTAGYRFVNLASWPQRLDAAAVLLGLWPGLAIVRRFGRICFTLGACTGVQRAHVEKVGGWAAFGDSLAEDNRLGATLAEAGRTIRLSRLVATLDSDALSWRDYWRHQRRVAVTYRVCQPAGFVGMIFTNGLLVGGLMVGLAPDDFAPAGIWMVFAVVIQVARWLWFRDLGRILRFPIPLLFPVLLAASAVELACWIAAWCDRRVWWAGRRWRVSRGGLLTPLG